MRKNQQPKIALEMGPADWLLEGVAGTGLVLVLILPAVYYAELPDTIPTHFNARGEADGFGSKATLWLMPGLGLILYLMMTILARYPHIFNYTVQITPENAERQYRMATRLVRLLKVFVMSLFAYLAWGSIQVATSRAATLDSFWLWFIIGANTTIIGWYLIQSYRKK